MNMLAPVVLLVTLKVEPDKLILSYSVENKSGVEIYLVNRLTRYEKDKGWLPDPSVVYVAFDDRGIIELSKRVPVEPENFLVTPRDYYVTPLPDSEKFEEELVLPLPLQEHHPYNPIVPPIPEPIEIEAVLVFSLGYFEARPDIEAQPIKVHGIETFQLVRRQAATPSNPQDVPSLSPKAERILSSELGQSRLPVIPIPKRQ